MNAEEKKKLEAVLKCIPGYDPWAQAESAGAWLDHEAALHAINWFAEHLTHVKGEAAGKPFILRRWQAAIVGNLFGWKRRNADDVIIRRYRKCLLVVGRGNGKTPLAAGIVLYAFFNDREVMAENYLAAGQKDQAGKLFEVGVAMIRQDETLHDQETSGEIVIRDGEQYREIKKTSDKSFIKVIPAEAGGQHGGIPHVTVIDELHVQDSRALVDVVETAMSKKTRTQPLFLMITTADEDRPSICNEIHHHAQCVRDNGGDPTKKGFDPTFLPVLYEASPEDDWTKDETFAKANPNLGVSVSIEGLREACRKAQETPAFEPAFKQLHLNLKTTSSTALINLNQWDACSKAELAAKVTVETLIGRRAFGGLDLSSSEDMTSFGLVFPLDDIEKDAIAILSYSWCPESKIRYRAKQLTPYDLWARKGFLESTDGDIIDHRAVRERINDLSKLYEIVDIGVDPAGATQMMVQLGQEDGLPVVSIPQVPANLSDATKDLLRRIKSGKVIHFDNPVLRWNAGNVSAYYRGRIPIGDRIDQHIDKLPIQPSKQKSKDKIDAIAAVVNALARMLVAPPAETGDSVYETRGIVAL